MSQLKKEPDVDIIIPNFNKAKFLDECIQSVIQQSYSNWKLFIIDDASKDNSINILKKYENMEKITIVKLKKNKGPAFCRNLGMRLSKSKYISFLDSDDIWTKDKLRKQIDFMIKHNYDFTYTDYLPFFHNINNKIFKKKTNLKKSFTYEEFILNSSINSSTMIINRNIVFNYKFKKTKILEDYLFKCEILKNGKTAYKLSDNLAFYRIVSNARSSNRILNFIWLWKINKKYNNLNIFNNIKSIIFISINSLKKYGIK
tara:strand:- start:34590 stop:35363 length:774 start_codon:yes stop_codon:yes gene_type:complete